MAIVTGGTTAPEFALEDLDGQTISLPDVLILHPVLLVFFRSDCELCQWALPQLARFEQTFSGHDLEVYYVTPDIGDVARDTLRAHRLEELHVLIDTGSKVAKDYGVEQLPAVVFIAPDGTIASSGEGWVPETYQAIGHQVKEQVAGIRGPLFGAAWHGDPCLVA